MSSRRFFPFALLCGWKNFVYDLLTIEWHRLLYFLAYEPKIDFNLGNYSLTTLLTARNVEWNKLRHSRYRRSMSKSTVTKKKTKYLNTCDHDPVSDSNLLRNPTSMLRFYMFRKCQCSIFFLALLNGLGEELFLPRLSSITVTVGLSKLFIDMRTDAGQNTWRTFLCLREFSLNSHLKFRRRAKKSNEY